MIIILLHVSRCVLETPVLLADLFVLSPGYKVPPDLATMPPPFSMCGLCSRCPQRWFKCSNRRYWHHDVKCIIFSCCNDVMNSYKRSHPDRMLFFGYRPPIEPSAMFVQPYALPESFRRSPLFSLSNKAAFELLLS